MKNQEIVFEIKSDIEELSRVSKKVEKIACQMGFSEDECDNISIGVTEVVNNAIIHGNKNNKDKKVVIAFKLMKNELTIFVTDEGIGFDPEKIDNPLEPENLLKEHGRGIFILKAVMDKVDFKFSAKGTTVIMHKKKKNRVSE
ncbi:ATP-binding protein [candidate division KSB1 bacterium]